MRSVKYAKALGFLILTAVVSSSALGQATTPTKSAKKEVPAKQQSSIAKPEKIEPVVAKVAEPTLKKFTLAAIQGSQLDLDVTRMSLEALVNAVNRVADVPKKGEFESTADYDARKAAVRSASFLDGGTFNDTFAIAVPVTKWAHDKLAYIFNPDAGDGALFVLPEVRTRGMKGIYGEGGYGEKSNQDFFSGLSYRNISRSTYEGSNAYGAKVTVDKSDNVSYGIATSRIPFLTFQRKEYYGSDFSLDSKATAVRFKIDSASAAKVIPAVKALVVFSLREPFILEDVLRSEPTRDKPTDVSTLYRYLVTNVLGIIWYSSSTGEIFACLPEGFCKPTPAPAKAE